MPLRDVLPQDSSQSANLDSTGADFTLVVDCVDQLNNPDLLEHRNEPLHSTAPTGSVHEALPQPAQEARVSLEHAPLHTSRDFSRRTAKHRIRRTDCYAPGSLHQSWLEAHRFGDMVDEASLYDNNLRRNDGIPRSAMSMSGAGADPERLVLNIPTSPKTGRLNTSNERQSPEISARVAAKLKRLEMDQDPELRQLTRGRRKRNKFARPKADIQDDFARLTVNEHYYPDSNIIHTDCLRQFQQSPNGSLIKIDHASKTDDSIDNSIGGASLKQVAMTDPEAFLTDIGQTKCLNAQEVARRPKAKRHDTGDQRKLRQLAMLPKKIADKEKHITTLQQGFQNRKTILQIEHFQRQALQWRVKLEQGEGRITNEEATELRKANRKLTGSSRRRAITKTEYEKSFDNLVDEVAGLLRT